MLGENVEDQHRAIDDRDRQDLLEVLALTRTQIVKHEDQLGVELLRECGDLVRLAAAHQQRRIDRRTLLHDAFEHARAGRFGQRFELGEFGFDRMGRVVQIDGHQDRRDRPGRGYFASGAKCSMSQRKPSL